MSNIIVYNFISVHILSIFKPEKLHKMVWCEIYGQTYREQIKQPVEFFNRLFY